MKIKLHLTNPKVLTPVVLVLLFVTLGSSAQTTRTSTGDNDWNSASTWTPAGIPAAGDIINIRPGDIVTVNSTPTNSVSSVTFGNTSNTTSGLSIASGVTLTVTGAVTLLNAATISTNASINGLGTLVCGALNIGSTNIPTAYTANPVTTSGDIGGKINKNTLTLNISNIVVNGNITINNDDKGGGIASQPQFTANSPCNITANSLIFTHTGNGAAGASLSNFTLGNGTTLNLTASNPILVDYNVSVKSTMIAVAFPSGSTVNMCSTQSTSSVTNSNTTAGTTSSPTISYTGVGGVHNNPSTYTTSWNITPDIDRAAIFDGTYTSDANLSACRVVVNSGRNVRITNTTNQAVVTVKNEVTVNGTGTLTFDNNTSLVQINNVPNSGNIIYKRDATNIRTLDYIYWSSPVAGFNVSNIVSPYSFGAIYKWNTTVANSNGGQGNWQNAAGDTMIAGKGYIARAPGTSPFNNTTFNTLNASFTGVPNNGTIKIAIERGSD